MYYIGIDTGTHTGIAVWSYSERKLVSVVYCDPPYKGTAGYGEEFDHEAFYDWCRKQENLTIISEYDMPEDFIEIANKTKSCSYSPKGVKKTVEKLFVPPQFAGYVKPGELF